MEKKQATLELGTKPVGRLLTQYALPAIVAMVASSLYNMVDSIFIGQGVGPLAISGLAITFPFMNLSGAFGAAIGVGASTLISVRLGQKDYKAAQNLFGNSITLNIIIGLLFATVCLVFLDPILQFFGATDKTIGYAREYMEVILLGNAVTHLYFGMNAILRSASKPKMAMYITMFTVILNTILDPIFIYILDMGIRGAAVATILTQFIAMCWQFWIFSNKKEVLHLCRGIYHLKQQLVRGIIGIGSSPFAMNACACLVVIFINTSLIKYGDEYAVGAYGIGNRLVFIFIMISIGINQGMQPIVGYNYGAKKYDRMMRAVNLAMVAATGATTLGWVICEFFPEHCVRLFTDDERLIAESVNGLEINAMVLFIIGFQMVVTNFFQSIGKAKISIFLSLSRQMIVLIPAIVILSSIWGVDGVWAALPVSDGVASLLALWFFLVYMKRYRHQKDEHGNEALVAPEDEGDSNERNYSYYTPRSGAAPRGMAPQAGGSLYEKKRNSKTKYEEHCNYRRCWLYW